MGLFSIFGGHKVQTSHPGCITSWWVQHDPPWYFNCSHLGQSWEGDSKSGINRACAHRLKVSQMISDDCSGKAETSPSAAPISGVLCSSSVALPILTQKEWVCLCGSMLSFGSGSHKQDACVCLTAVCRASATLQHFLYHHSKLFKHYPLNPICHCTLSQ